MTNKGQLTRELGVSGSVSERRAEGEVGRSDILGAAVSEKSATYFRSINEKNPPKNRSMSRMMQSKTHCYNEGAWREKKMREN